MDFNKLIIEYKNNRASKSICKKILQQMHDEIKFSTSSFEIGAYNYYKADYFYSQDKIEASLKKLNIALQHLQSIVPTVELITCFNLLGLISVLKSNHFAAIDYYLKANTIATKLDNKRYLMILCNNIGNIFLNKYSYKKAVKYYRKGLGFVKVLEPNQIGSMEAILRHNLAEAYAIGQECEKSKNQLSKLDKFDDKYFVVSKEFTFNYINSLIYAQKHNCEALKKCINTIYTYINDKLPLESLVIIIEALEYWLLCDVDDEILRVLNQVNLELKRHGFMYFKKEFYQIQSKYYKKIKDHANYQISYTNYMKAIEESENQEIIRGITSLIDRVDLYELTNQLKATHKIIYIDELTGLYNRHILNDLIPRKIFALRKKCNNIAVVMIDIDNFKQLNDYNGHLTGDNCLKDISKIILENVSDNIVAMRYGGDEFVLFIFGHDKNQISDICHAIQDNVKALNYIANNQAQSIITVSIGCYINKINNMQLNEYIQRADLRLYDAKKIKNKIIIEME